MAMRQSALIDRISGGIIKSLTGKEWDTPKNYGPEAEAAKRAIREGWNSPARFSVKEQRWKPRMSTSQDVAMKLMAEAWAHHRSGGLREIPLRPINRSTLRSLQSRGWVDSRLPKLTALGLAVVREFWPAYL